MLKYLYILGIFAVLSAQKTQYNGHQVIRITPKTYSELQEVLAFQEYLELENVDIWKRCSDIQSSLDFRLSLDNHHVMDQLPSDVQFEVLIHDIQALDDYVMKLNSMSVKAMDFDYGKYHPLSDISSWMSMMVSKNPTIASMFNIATSFEGRPLNGIKISAKTNPDRPSLWFEGGIHAREWISPATMLYMTAQLLEQYGTDSEITSLLDTFDVYMIPVVNVDGYEYTWTTDRMWRKTRSKRNGQTCIGADPNRNWNFHWCEMPGASSDPCSNSYCGVRPFSENVVGGIANYIANKTTNMMGFIDFHAYSQMWMTPWGYTKASPIDAAQQNASSLAAVEAIQEVHGTKFTFGSIANIIYVATGSSADWTYGVAKIKYSVGVELRDTGHFGFVLPPDQIIPSGQETLKGLLAFMNYIKMNM